MARLITILFFVVCCQSRAQGTFNFVASTPHPVDTLFGSGSLTLQGNTLSYQIQVTGPTLGGYGRGLNGQIDRQATLTLNAHASSMPFGLMVVGYGDRNYDLIVRLPGEPPLPLDYYWAHDYFGGSVALSDADISALFAGDASLTISYGFFGSVTGPIVVVPEPSTLALALVVAAFFFLRPRKVSF